MKKLMDAADYLHLSGIQHFIFCPRQWALIHIEQQWQDNVYTFKGQELHQKTNDPFINEKRGEVLISRALPLVSHSLGLYGIADVVEFKRVETGGVKIPQRSGFWRPTPVEYKVGSPKPTGCDLAQLCAQVISLEEKFEVSITHANMFYGKTRRRLEVKIDEALREKTKKAAMEMHTLFEKGITPSAKLTKACEKCSLIEICMPKLYTSYTVNDYLSRALRE